MTVVIKFVVSLTMVNNNPLLTIDNDNPLLTIINNDPLLTIVSNDPLLIIVNDDPSLTIVDIIFRKDHLKKKSYKNCHKLFLKNDSFLKRSLFVS